MFVPPCNPTDSDHVDLAWLSQKLHDIVVAAELSGEVVKARRLARAAVAAEIAAIDVIARRVLGLGDTVTVETGDVDVVEAGDGEA